MEIPKIKKDESLAAWRVRLAQELNLDYKTRLLIYEVSVTSYMYGSNTAIDMLKKEVKIDDQGV